jgi:hypothetical protein
MRQTMKNEYDSKECLGQQAEADMDADRVLSENKCGCPHNLHCLAIEPTAYL